MHGNSFEVQQHISNKVSCFKKRYHNKESPYICNINSNL